MKNEKCNSTKKLPILAFSLIIYLSLPSHGAYKLVWSDEFDGTKLDPASWTHEVGDNWHNEELQAYTDRPKNSYVKDGKLVIVAQKESYHEKEYTSARIITQGKRDFLYGKIEARIKLPKGQGMWPAFWMMPTDSEYGRWAASGEIDILESTNNADHISGTLHFGGPPPNNTFSSSGRHTEEGVNFSDDYHVYSLEWQPYEMKWFIDGNLYSTKTQWHTQGNPYPAPFDKRFYIILNLAVGGRLPGNPDKTTVFPQHLNIDWVRVYQTENKTPQVTIKKPTQNAVIPADTDITIEADVNDPDDNVDKVEFYDDYELIATDSSEPYSIDFAPPDGCYNIKVKAIDKEGFSHSANVKVTKGSGCPQAPFHGTPFTIPGKIQAEDFDQGGMNVAYFVADTNRRSSTYRKNTDVYIRTYRGINYSVRLRDKEWLEYTVDVTKPGKYDITAHLSAGRRRNENEQSKFHIEIDGIDKTSSVTVPMSRERWSMVDATASNIELSAGKHIMRFVVENRRFSIDYFEIKEHKEKTEDPNKTKS